jgi:hypothetical protein
VVFTFFDPDRDSFPLLTWPSFDTEQCAGNHDRDKLKPILAGFIPELGR